MDLSKYIDKTIRVKFQGGREGEPGAWLRHSCSRCFPVKGRRGVAGCFYLLVVAIIGVKFFLFDYSIHLLGTLLSLWLICAPHTISL